MGLEKGPIRLIFKGKIRPVHLKRLQKKVKEIRKRGALAITLSSPGGDSNTAKSIVEIIRQLKAGGVQVTTHGIKQVASSALLIFLQGDTQKRTAREDAIFTFDLPHKVENKPILLGYKDTTVYLEKLLNDNQKVINARKEWTQVMSSATNLSVNEINAMEGKEITVEFAAKYGIICHTKR